MENCGSLKALSSQNDSAADKKEDGLKNLDHESKTESKMTLKQLFPQLLAAIAALFGGFSFGNVLCFSSVAMPSLRLDHEGFDGGRPTEEQISWISSVFYLGAVLVCGPTGVALDRFGRRKVMLYLSIPFVCGWLLIYFARNFEMIMIGRFITGFFGGASSVAAPTFIAETSSKNIRGMMINGFELTLCFGCFYILAVGAFFSWRNQALACAFIPLIGHAILLLVPESPRYLLSKGQVEAAEHSLYWLRGSDCEKTEKSLDFQVEAEFKSLMEDIAQDEKESSSNWRAQWRELKSRAVGKGLLISFPLFFFQEFSGICALDLYIVETFQAAGTFLDEHLSSIIIISAATTAAGLSTLVVDRYGRRILLAISELVTAIALAGLGSFFYVQKHDPTFASKNLSWLPLLSMAFIVLGFSFGIGPIPYSIMAEVLPQRVRGLGSSILLTSKWAMTFFIGRFFKDFMGAVGQAAGYWSFASICILGLLFVLVFIPETKGKSLEEIQKDMNKSKQNTKDGSQSKV